MAGAFIYIRTSGDDAANEKLGVDVQRTACNSIARHLGLVLTGEFVDDGVSGKVPMHSRPQGKRMMAYLLANGTKTIITYDGKRIGRTQPVYWAFIGMARDNDIQVLDKDGKNLCESVQGGIEGLMSELDHTATVARFKLARRFTGNVASGLRADGLMARIPMSTTPGNATWLNVSARCARLAQHAMPLPRH